MDLEALDAASPSASVPAASPVSVSPCRRRGGSASPWASRLSASPISRPRRRRCHPTSARAHPGDMLVLIDSRREEPYRRRAGCGSPFREAPRFMTLAEIATPILPRATARPSSPVTALDLWSEARPATALSPGRRCAEAILLTRCQFRSHYAVAAGAALSAAPPTSPYPRSAGTDATAAAARLGPFDTRAPGRDASALFYRDLGSAVECPILRRDTGDARCQPAQILSIDEEPVGFAPDLCRRWTKSNCS